MEESAYNGYLENISKMKIYGHIFRQIIHRGKKIELCQYEDPKFYDSLSRAMDEALEQGMGGMFVAAWGAGWVVRADADCIRMFDNGEIIEQITHRELDGQYAEMFRCQAKYYQDIDNPQNGQEKDFDPCYNRFTLQ